MVWFQCEDCGDNLKKPKLPNHFRMCSASKLSCIDCGQLFGRQDVEGHTQCITEAEKYGPKGQGKPVNGSNAKPNNASNQKPDIDISVGLSDSAPWFCSMYSHKGITPGNWNQNTVIGKQPEASFKLRENPIFLGALPLALDMIADGKKLGAWQHCEKPFLSCQILCMVTPRAIFRSIFGEEHALKQAQL